MSSPPKMSVQWALPRDRNGLMLLLAGWLVVGLIGIMAAPQPLIALGLMLAVPGMVALVAWPEIATLAVVVILYSNAAVVAVRFHGLPYAVGACLPLLLVIPLTGYLIVQKQKVIVDSVLRLMVLLLLVYMIASLFSDDVSRSSEQVMVFLVEGLGLYFLVINVVRKPATLRSVTWALLCVGAFLGALSTWQQVTKTYDNNYGGFAQMSDASMFRTGEMGPDGVARQHRLAGPLTEMNRYGQIMMMLVPLGMFRFWGERSNALRTLALLATALTISGMALTFSRGAAVGFLMMLMIVALLRYITVTQFGIMILGILLTLFLLPQYAYRLASLSEIGNVLSRPTNAMANADGAIRSRSTEVRAAALMFSEHPIIGVGPGMYPAHYWEYAKRVGGRVRLGQRQPHILYLGIAAELGAVGLILFLIIWMLCLRNLARARRLCRVSNPDLSALATGYMLAIIAYLTSGFSMHLSYIRYFWLMMALAGAASYIAGSAVSTASLPRRPATLGEEIAAGQ